MSMFGQVYVKDNQYKIRGDFHNLTPNMPIRNASNGWNLLGVTNPRDMTYIHSYGGEAVFFESLSKGRLMATRCDNPKCETKFDLPAVQNILPRMPGKNTVIDMTDIAKKRQGAHLHGVRAFGAFNILPRPIKFINVEFEGVVTILMGYLSLGEPAIGMRVTPIF